MTDEHNHNQAIIDEFHANAGKVGGHFAGKTMLLLHTVGAKSGKQHVNPVMYITDGDRLVIIASKGGSPTNPGWYHNILAHPLVTVEVGTEIFKAQATVATEPERTRLYDKMVAMWSVFDGYRQKTVRQIPVIILNRV